jgi:hypothetical protein
MFGFGLKKVFMNRWSALWWALGMVFTAWQMVPDPDPDDAPAAAPSPAAAHPANPWAK